MGNNNLQRKYSLRKFKGIGLASAVIGLFFANTAVYAEVTSGGKNETTVVTGADNEFVTEKISASHKTTFTDDKDSTKKVTVDAVIGNVKRFPKKVNEYFGDPDGTDRVNFSKKATVNYLLEEDHSKITESKIYEEKGNVYTNYDKKGISYDTDGKAYRGSGIERTGSEINENTGREFHLEANNKAYRWVRSEVVDKEKAVYEKTRFNDIEASVSPEGMHNYLGEINYGKITGKVYLVEETTDGHYGKYVEASNINSDEEAVNAWKNGQATAKDFTKENVTLQEGDTVLVMDRDTYADARTHASGVRTVNTINYRREKVPAIPEYNRTEPYVREEGVQGYPSYALWDQPLTGEYPTIGEDKIFGTADDGKVMFNNETTLFYSNSSKSYPPGITDPKVHDFRKESLREILEVMHSEAYSILNYFNQNAKSDEEKQDLKMRKAKLDENIASTIEMIKQNHIDIAIESDRGIMFFQQNKEALKNLRKHIEEGQNVLNDLSVALDSTKRNIEQYDNHVDVTETKRNYLKFGFDRGIQKGYILSYHKDAVPEHYSDWKIEYPEVETRETPAYANKGVVTISDDLNNIKVVDKNQKTTETEFTKQVVTTKEETNYEVKELITPVRAYKVMDEGSPVVNHYYKMVTNRAMIPSHVRDEKVGTLMIQYVSESGDKLRSDIVYKVPYEIRKIYDVVSGKTKVGEESVVEKLKPVYDTTPERFNTIIADKTGFTYEFDAVGVDSAPETSVFDKPQTIVSYVYRLVTKEDPRPTNKEEKGSVIVKYVDAEGNEIKDAEKVVNDAVVKTTKTYTTKSGDVVVSTRDEVENHDVVYNAADRKVDSITKDGKKYNYQGIYATSEKFHNVTAETGKVVEGITTVVYQYQLEAENLQWEVSQNPPIVEVPEYTGGTSVPESPINEVQEFSGGAVAIEPPIYTKPTLIITKWVDENGIALKPADVKEPVKLGQPNEPFEHGTIEGYEYIGTVRNQEGDVVTHVFRKLDSESKVPNTPQRNSENPKQEEPTKEEVTSESPKNKAETSEELSTSHSVVVPQSNQLPQTGTGDELALVSAATTAILAGLGIARPKKKQ